MDKKARRYVHIYIYNTRMSGERTGLFSGDGLSCQALHLLQIQTGEGEGGGE